MGPCHLIDETDGRISLRLAQSSKGQREGQRRAHELRGTQSDRPIAMRGALLDGPRSWHLLPQRHLRDALVAMQQTPADDEAAATTEPPREWKSILLARRLFLPPLTATATGLPGF